MTYIENIFACIAAPLLISMLFLDRRNARVIVFCLVGMAMCLLSAYVNTFFARLYRAQAVSEVTQISSVVEEVMKLLPLLFYLSVFEPERRDFRLAAMTVAISFATFENICYLAQNGASRLSLLLIRGFGTGAMHVVCGGFYGNFLRYVWDRRLLRAACLFGLLSLGVTYHSIYNLLVSIGGRAQLIGYSIPMATMFVIAVAGRLRRRTDTT